MTIQDAATIALLAVSIITPLGTWQWALSERGRKDRERLELKMDDLESCFHRLHAENVGKINKLSEDVAVLKDRSLQRRHTDFAG